MMQIAVHAPNFKRMINFLDVNRRVEFLSLIEADERGFLGSIPPALRHKSFHLIAADGDVLSGAAAIPRLIGMLPAGRAASWLVTSTPGGIASVAFVYSVFSRLHGSGSCRSKPGKASC